jgi:hypothetical protein
MTDRARNASCCVKSQLGGQVCARGLHLASMKTCVVSLVLLLATVLLSARAHTFAQAVTSYLDGRPFELTVRRGDRLVPAPMELLLLARTYPQFAHKGKVFDGRRITLMTERQRYRVDEAVRVIHVLEAVDRRVLVYDMGPKPVFEEYVDGARVSPRWMAAPYDGVVLDGPAVDFNYDVTEYRFHAPGRHAIEWRGGGAQIESLQGLRSNTVVVSIVR